MDIPVSRISKSVQRGIWPFQEADSTHISPFTTLGIMPGRNVAQVKPRITWTSHGGNESIIALMHGAIPIYEQIGQSKKNFRDPYTSLGDSLE